MSDGTKSRLVVTLPSCGVMSVNCALNGPVPTDVTAAMMQMKVV